MKEQILQMAESAAPRLREIWEDLHRNPELGFEEFRTAGKVEEILRSLDIETETGVAGTGVVGLIRGAQPGKTLLIRADMDARPIEEATGLACASRCAGKMHACGHDAHVTWLLGTAMILSRLRGRLHGTVKLLFQPSEERSCGAERVVQAGVLQGVDMALAAHVTPDYDAGTYLIQEGAVTSNPDFFRLKLFGKGSHGSEPQSAVDAINMGVQVYELLQTFVSRVCVPADPVVLSVCTFQSGTNWGTIPGECELSGTVRSFRPEIPEKAKAFIEDCAKAVTSLYGGRYELMYRIACWPVQNEPTLTARVRANTAELLGSGAVASEADKYMGGEDFCYISREVPSVYLFAGCRNDALFQAVPLHNPSFRLDDSILPRTAALFAYNALKLLEA